MRAIFIKLIIEGDYIMKKCVLQFTGGRDSTLTALKLIEEFKYNELHLLTFKTDLTTDLEKVKTNIEKLRLYFGETAKIVHKIIDTNDLLKDMVQKNYIKNIFKYHTFYVSTFCPSCRLSHHTHTIIYCLQNGIKNVADGVNDLTGFDLFQQEWAVEKVRKLYENYEIDYFTPLLKETISSEQILKEKYNNTTSEFIFYESQPKCIGGGQFHNLHLRCYYLPKNGKDKYIHISKEWIDDKLEMVHKHIENHNKL